MAKTSKIGQRLREKLEAMRAKRRAKRRGREADLRGILDRVEAGLRSRMGKVPVDELRERGARAFLRVLVKIALDRAGVVNTKRDPNKRQRIHGLVERISERVESIDAWGKARDLYLFELWKELETELGKRKMKRFTLEMQRMLSETEYWGIDDGFGFG